MFVWSMRIRPKPTTITDYKFKKLMFVWSMRIRPKPTTWVLQGSSLDPKMQFPVSSAINTGQGRIVAINVMVRTANIVTWLNMVW
jgi:hypothetical protein